MDPVPATPELALKDELAKHKVLVGILIMVVTVLGLLSTFFGYSYKKEKTLNVTLSVENDTLKKQVNSHTDTTTVTQPTLLDGHVAYTTTTHTTTDTAENTEATHNAAVSTVVKTEKVVERDFATVGFGINTHGDTCLLGQADVLGTPIGHFGIALVPDLANIKYSSGYVTWKP